MRKIVIILLLIAFQSVTGQRMTEDVFIVGQDTIKYTRLNYSEYGVSSLYITMYDVNDKTSKIVSKANGFLRKMYPLYHTLYFFVPLEKEYSQDHKEKLFAAFMKYIYAKENLKIDRLYLNFDNDYSKQYINSQINSLSAPSHTRIKTNIKDRGIRWVLLR